LLLLRRLQRTDKIKLLLLCCSNGLCITHHIRSMLAELQTAASNRRECTDLRIDRPHAVSRKLLLIQQASTSSSCRSISCHIAAGAAYLCGAAAAAPQARHTMLLLLLLLLLSILLP
jgi:hypothetical protein